MFTISCKGKYYFWFNSGFSCCKYSVWTCK